ncbi:PKD domain-containing protein [Halovivax cerinus]|uniref:PKD domain-containing protein n=1 Tax=Halovivax cerinus TaxID=1487865 RepID=A0ABD5NPQ5_9EURY|nr:PKD domain-containing protein [Halovivax cerinus]
MNRRRLLFGVLALGFVLLAGAGTAAADAPNCADVTYTQSNGAYEIDSVEKLQCISSQGLDADYVLTENIDASETATWNGGDGFDPIGDVDFSRDDWFTGTFDGNGNEISGLTISRPNERFTGLFDGIGATGSVAHLRLSGAVLDTYSQTGILTGENQGTISDVTVEGTVSGDSAQVGGLVGLNGGIVTRSSSFGSVSGGNYVGGLVGDQVASNADAITQSYAASTVSTSPQYYGGLVGRNNGDIPLDTTYWNTDLTDQGVVDSPAPPIGLTTDEMQGADAVSHMDGLDFDTVWKTRTNPAGYPLLRSFVDPASVSFGSPSISTESVSAGDTVDASITVENAGKLAGRYNVSLAVDGTIEEWVNGTIDGGSTETVAITQTLTDIGDRSVTVTGGSATATETVSVSDETAPTAEAGVDKTTDEDTTLAFDGSGSTDNGNIDSFEWKFDDDSTATGKTAGHTYADPGTYTVTLTVTDAAGNTDIDTAIVTVEDVTDPSADVGGDRTIDEDAIRTFDASASSDNVDVVSYEWDFGDDTTATGETVEHAYADPDEYIVTLTVTDGAGNTDTDTVTVTVEDVTPPAADAGADQTVDEDSSVSFDASASSDNVGIASYAWDLGDGSTATGETATHTYTDPGEYTATLTVADDAGNTDTDTVTVTVEDVTAPTADAGSGLTADEDTAISFDASASTDNDAIATYVWDLGDGSTATGETATHTYTDPGTYTVTLTVTDEVGNTDTDTVTVTVEDVTVPTADAGSDLTGDEDSSVSFDASASTDNDAIASYAWDFGDGSTATGETATHTYADPGTYTATLTVTDDAGNTDTDTVTVTVEDVTAPTADATTNESTGTATEAIAFDGSGSIDNHAIASYAWDLGDGSTAAGETVEHTYDAPGAYTVTLTVTDDAGTTDTATVTVTVEPGPATAVTVETQPSDSTAGDSITGPPAALVTDTKGNPVPDVPVDVAVSLGGGAITDGETTLETDANGVATFDDLVVETADAYRLRFSIDDDGTVESSDWVDSTVFDVTSAAVDSVAVETHPADTTAGEAIAGPPTAIVSDQYGNPVPGVDVEVTVNGSFAGGATTNATGADGTATFSALVVDAAGSYELSFEVAGRAAVTTEAFTVDAGQAASVAVVTQPGETIDGDSIAGPPTALVVDASGNPVAGVDVTATVNDTFESGATTVQTAADGTATFADLVVDSTGRYALTFEAAGVGSAATSDGFAVLAPANISVSVLDPATAEIAPNESLSVTAAVSNGGDLEGTQDVEFRLDGEAVSARTVTLGGGESTTVAFDNVSTSHLGPGDYAYGVYGIEGDATGTLTVLEPAVFEVSDLSPGDVTADASESVDVTATVTNTGQVGGTERVTLTLDGADRGNRTVDLDGGKSTPVTYEDVSLPSSSGEYRYAVGTTDDEASAIATVESSPLPPRTPISVRSATLETDVVSVGEPVTIEATIENPRKTSVHVSSALSVDGDGVETATVRVPADGTQTITFERAFDAPGEYDLAVDGVSAGTVTVTEESSVPSVVDVVLVTDEVVAGEEVIVEATVENSGTEERTHVVTLSLDGTIVANETIALGAGDREPVTVTHVVDEPGTYTLTVGDDGFDVTVSPAGSSTDASENSGESGGSETPDEPSSTDGVPGFGVFGAVLALCAVAIRRSRR